MKRCPDCRRDYYDDSLMYCLDDGAALLEGPSSGNEQATAVYPTDPISEAPTRAIGGTPSNSQPYSAGNSYPLPARRLAPTILLAAVGSIVLLAAGGFGLYKALNKPEPQVSAAPLQIEKLTTNGQATFAAISPDGKYVIYGIDEGGKDSLWLRQVATTSNVQIFQPLEDVYYWGLTFSPDSNYVNFIRAEFEKNVEWGLNQMSVLGGAQKKLMKHIEGGISYSPDGSQFAFIRDEFPSAEESALMVANADGTGERVIASRRKPEIFPSRRVAPAWAPDGKTIAAIISDESTMIQNPQIAAFDVAGGTSRLIATQEWKSMSAIAWTADKRGLLVLGSDKASASFNNQIWHFNSPDGAVRRITTDLNHYNGLSLDASAKTLVTVQSNEISNLWVVPNGDYTRAVQIRSGGTNQEGIGGLALAPDGRVIFHSQASGRDDLWIMNADGSSPKQLTTDSVANFQPAVSPDGRYIVYASERDGKVNVWRMGIDGSGASQLTHGNSDYFPSVSPDSRWVVYTSETGGNSFLHRVPIDGGEPAKLTQGFSNSPEISPDGKWIVCSYRKDENSTWRYGIIPFEGGEPVKVFDLLGKKGNFRWSPDSRSLYYLRDTKGGVTNLWTYHLEKGESKQVTDFKNETIFDFVWSVDGKQLVMSRGTPTSDVVILRNF